MTDEQIIQVWKSIPDQGNPTGKKFAVVFAKEISKLEREECAKICTAEARMHESLDKNGRSRHIDDAEVARTCAAAIRARNSENI